MSIRSRADTDPEGITRIWDPLGAGRRAEAIGEPARPAAPPRRRGSGSGSWSTVVVLLVVLALVWPAMIFAGRTKDVVDQCRRTSTSAEQFRERSGDFVRCLFTT